ncbi:MAG: hypothetical protein FJX47_04310 [Alphaproteobacteria bacterium]|nr:hypothetical protein [Alphaproteobacteria bacterium]
MKRIIAAAALAVAVSLPVQAQEPASYKIGAILAMSGPASLYGTLMSRGINLAVEEINAKGGVNGVKLEAIIEDHKSGKAEEGVAAINRLISIHGVSAVMSSFSPPTLAIAPIADEKKIFVINGGGVSNALVGASKYLYHNRSLASDLGIGAVMRAKDLGAKKLAYVQWRTDAGDSIAKATEEFWKKGGGSVVAAESVQQGSTNIDTQVAKIRAAQPDAVGVWMFAPEVGLGIKRLREFGYRGPMIGVEFTKKDAELAGALADGFEYVTDYFRPSDEAPWSKAFHEAHLKKFNEAPEFYGANYYEGVYVIAELISRARKAGVAAAGLNGETLKAALVANPSFDSVYGGKMTFQPNGVALKRVALFKVEGGDGKFQKFLELK